MQHVQKVVNIIALTFNLIATGKRITRVALVAGTDRLVVLYIATGVKTARADTGVDTSAAEAG